MSDENTSNPIDNVDQLIITRFNYRFKETNPVGDLFDPDKWRHRMQVFESFCYSSIVAQKNRNFDWILIVDQLLPLDLRAQLEALIQRHYESAEYHKHGPRKIYLYAWDYQYHLSDPHWIEQFRPLRGRWLITSRLDNDDSLCQDFTDMLRQVAKKERIEGFLLVSYGLGYTWNPHSDHQHGIFRISQRPMMALGLSLISDRPKYPLTVYFGRHTRLLSYIKKPHQHPILKELYERAGDLPAPTQTATTQTKRTLKTTRRSRIDHRRFLIIRRSIPIYIRTIHGANLQPNLQQHQTRRKHHLNNQPIIRKYFQLNWGEIEQLKPEADQAKAKEKAKKVTRIANTGAKKRENLATKVVKTTNSRSRITTKKTVATTPTTKIVTLGKPKITKKVSKKITKPTTAATLIQEDDVGINYGLKATRRRQTRIIRQ